ncbi:MAG TPA: hypothetical protein VKH34_15665 [Vicinamibacterales bacterium]|nr:hypothetical protein [Vicinamibacterales bacterium]
MTTRVSLTELAAADITLRPDEAVGLVVEICRQHAAGLLPAIPSPGIIRLTSAGGVVVEGPMATEEATVARAAHLLSELMPDFDAPSDYRASGGLRLVLARALRTLDLPAYDNLDGFAAALRRFAAPDLAGSARSLFRAWEKARAAHAPAAPGSAAPSELTISDVRRARRATGLSLDDLAVVAEVPAERLRELEWGYLRHWQADPEARAQVVRYARAAGLDEQIVLAIVWPMIEELPAPAVADLEAEAATALVLAGPRSLATVAAATPPHPAPGAVASWALAAIGAALVALATFGILADSAQGAGTPTTTAADVSAETVPVRAVDETPVTRAPGSERQAPAKASPSPTVRRAPAAAAPQRGARPAAPDRRRPAARPKPFLERELFRIVFR